MRVNKISHKKSAPNKIEYFAKTGSKAIRLTFHWPLFYAFALSFRLQQTNTYAMKKILTLIIAIGFLGAVQAQTSRDEARRIILGQEKNKNGTVSGKSRDIILGDGNRDNRRVYPNSQGSRADKINREYNAKIYSIRNNPNLSGAEKDRIIRQLEQDRNKKLSQVNYGRNDKKYKNNKKYKSNNGKHKGWSKGKGNKHRDRDDD